jgi:hypothetical protein
MIWSIDISKFHNLESGCETIGHNSRIQKRLLKFWYFLMISNQVKPK